MVTVRVSDSGDVSLRGDGRDNYVQIERVEIAPGTFQVQVVGQTDRDGNPTQVRLGRDLFTTLPLTQLPNGAIDQLTISLGGGDDFLRMDKLEISGPVRINLAGGGDSLRIFDSQLTGSLSLRSASGNDVAFFDQTTLQGPVDINTRGGADWVGFIGGTANGATLRLDTGGGPDLISFEQIAVSADVSLNAGSFPDELYLGAGTTFSGAVQADLGSFADALMVETGVTFADLSQVVLTGNRRGPNFENAVFLQAGVSLSSLPDLSSYGLSFTGITDLSDEFDFRMGNIDVNIRFVDSLKTALYRRGFEFSEMAIDNSVLSQTDLDDLTASILAGLQSTGQLERILYQQIFRPDYA